MAVKEEIVTVGAVELESLIRERFSLAADTPIKWLVGDTNSAGSLTGVWRREFNGAQFVISKVPFKHKSPCMR